MGEPVVALPSFDELSRYVRQALCDQDALDPAQAPFFRAVVRRGGRPWGVVFHVEGPRLLKTSAVWAADEDRIVFYDSTGQRTRVVRLSEAPELPAEANGRRQPAGAPRDGGLRGAAARSPADAAPAG